MNPYKSFNFNQDFPLVIGNQTAHIDLKGKVQIYYDESNPNEAAILVSLENTTISALEGTGGMPFDSDSERGYFTESLYLTMEVVDSNNEPLIVQSDSPGTSEIHQSISSTVSLSAGFFGDQITGSASISNTLSQSLTDFRVNNASRHTTVIHQYQLASCDGGTYKGWWDLLETTDLAVVTTSNGNLHSLTSSAIHNYEIISQAIFITNYRRGARLQLNVNLFGYWRKVWVETNEFLILPISYEPKCDLKTLSAAKSVLFNL